MSDTNSESYFQYHFSNNPSVRGYAHKTQSNDWFWSLSRGGGQIKIINASYTPTKKEAIKAIHEAYSAYRRQGIDEGALEDAKRGCLTRISQLESFS